MQTLRIRGLPAQQDAEEMSTGRTAFLAGGLRHFSTEQQSGLIGSISVTRNQWILDARHLDARYLFSSFHARLRRREWWWQQQHGLRWWRWIRWRWWRVQLVNDTTISILIGEAMLLAFILGAFFGLVLVGLRIRIYGMQKVGWRETWELLNVRWTLTL